VIHHLYPGQIHGSLPLSSDRGRHLVLRQVVAHSSAAVDPNRRSIDLPLLRSDGNSLYDPSGEDFFGG
ncbi:MAG TPA: hypothetical protein V6D12_12370, partial [Candidatus Obscuribacterales bacterium]